MIGCCPNTLFACQRSFCINLMILKFAVIVAAVLLLLPAHADAKNIVKAGSDILVEEGQTVDNVAVIGGQITVSGLVENNVLAIAGSVVLTNKAVVRGKVIVKLENVRQCCILLQLSNVGNRLILKIFQDLQIMP